MISEELICFKETLEDYNVIFNKFNHLKKTLENN